MTGPIQRPRGGFVPVFSGHVWYKIVGSGSAIPLLILHGGSGAGHGLEDGKIVDRFGLSVQPRHLLI